jgi:hypothetical protein
VVDTVSPFAVLTGKSAYRRVMFGWPHERPHTA